MKKRIKKILTSQKQKAILVRSAFHSTASDKRMKITGLNALIAILVIVWASFQRFG